MGVGKALKEHNPQIKIVCAHPVKGHYIQGLKNMEEAIVPSIYDPSKGHYIQGLKNMEEAIVPAIYDP
jgi:cysteine synthase B